MVNVIVLFPKQEVARSIRNLLVRSCLLYTSHSAFIVREISRTSSNFRREEDLEDYLKEHDIPGPGRGTAIRMYLPLVELLEEDLDDDTPVDRG